MLERLKLALMLPTSRKVLVGLAAGSLAIANKKYGWGLDDGSIQMLIGLACFVILGISLEDAAKAHADGTKAAAEIANDADAAFDAGHAEGRKAANDEAAVKTVLGIPKETAK